MELSRGRRPSVETRSSAVSGGWEGFLRVYEPLLRRELSQRHPEFMRALHQLERDTRLEYERQNAQVLATLRLKDKRISELQKVVSEQHEQLDVLLDELERRATTVEAGTQVESGQQSEPRKVEVAVVSVQTDVAEVPQTDADTQTEMTEESEVLVGLEKLEREMKMLEERNLALEKELQRHLSKNEAQEKTEDAQRRMEERARVEACLETLQQGMDMMNLSCSCVDNPLVLFSGLPGGNVTRGLRSDGNFGFTTASTCVNLEHRLEAQAIRLMHVQECLCLWREAAVQFMKRPNPNDHIAKAVIPSFSPAPLARGDEEEAGLHCSLVLRGALTQIRQCVFERRATSSDDNQRVLQELAKLLAKSKGSTKAAAKVVQKWAGWEASHLEEMRALRQGFAEEQAVALSRRTALLKQIDQLEQQQIDVQAEVNALKKKPKVQDGKSDEALSVIALPDKSVKVPSEVDKREEVLTCPQLLLKLVTAEQSLLAKDEQLKTANDTISALLSCAATSSPLHSPDASDPRSGGSMDAISRLISELQRSSLQKVEFFRRREKDLVNLSQYFQMEKSCLQLQSRLETEQKRTAVLESAQSVCEQERDGLLMKVEKLEMEVMLTNLTRKSTVPSIPFGLQTKDTMESVHDINDPLYFVLRRQRLLEENCRALRENLRHSQQQVTLMKQQHRFERQQKIVQEGELQATIFDCVAEHHYKCVNTFKSFFDKEFSVQVPPSGQLGADQGNDTSKQPKSEWEVFLSHYDALWIAFHTVYNFLGESPQSVQNGGLCGGATASNISILGVFGVPVSTEGDAPFNELGASDFELSKRDEKILLLQQMIMEKEEQLRGGRPSTFCTDQPESVLPLMNSEPSQLERKGVDKEPLNDTSWPDGQTESERPFLVSKKPPAPCQDVNAVGKTLGSEVYARSMEVREHHVDTNIELEKCLAKCAELTAQNAKLSRRLRAEKESSKQQLKDQHELQTQLNATTSVNSKLQLSLSQFQEQVGTSATRNSSLVNDALLERSALSNMKEQHAATSADNTAKSKSSLGHVRLQEHEALKDQLASREQENLALVQSLCEIKEECAQMEATHQKELRAQTTNHAESMETYMGTVNETLSRIESDKNRLEEVNAQLRLKLQHLEADSARLKLEQTMRSSKGVNTDSAPYSHDLDTLEARVQDLELQLARERKLAEAVERNQQLENQQDEQHETNAKMEAAKAKEQFEMRCDTLQEWRTKIEHEFAEYQTVQRAAQQESDRRLAFLSDCVREFVRLADATSSSGGKTMSTKDLYDAVMLIARNPPRDASRGGLSISQSKHRPKSKASTLRDRCSVVPARGDKWIEKPIEESRDPDELEESELTWWKLRAAKMESYLRVATQQNVTFEDTIERLEVRMNDVKEQLSMRLTRESQLVSTLVALKDELATAKEQTTALAEKHQLTSAELEKRVGEVTSRGDETQRARMAMQRKTELLAQQKSKVALLQQELEQASKKAERLIAAEKQTALLQQKAKDNTQQLLHTREGFERCRDDNVQLSLHVEKMKERHATVLTRLKAARAESAQLRTQLAELKKTTKADATQPDADKNGKEITGMNAVSVASLTEETRALKRRVLQKQEVIASYKAKVAGLEAQLERQRETMVKLARTNRELQQGQRQRQIQEHENASFLQARIETQLVMKQEQLDGLRASIYDSCEAFVYCRRPYASNQAKSPPSSIMDSLDSPWTDEDDSDDKLLAIRRWTDFSSHDLEELKVARSPRRAYGRAIKNGVGSAKTKRAAVIALREIEGALETNPEDCRTEICQLLQCLCD